MNGVLIFMKHDEIMPYMIMLIIMFMIHNSNMYIYSEWVLIFMKHNEIMSYMIMLTIMFMIHYSNIDTLEGDIYKISCFMRTFLIIFNHYTI